MSIKFSKIISFATAILLTLLFLLQTKKSYAWDGYDFEKNSKIYIGAGNLVREGSIIKLYDYSDNQYHYVEVITMNSSFNGTQLTCVDTESKRKMVLQMDLD